MLLVAIREYLNNLEKAPSCNHVGPKDILHLFKYAFELITSASSIVNTSFSSGAFCFAQHYDIATRCSFYVPQIKYKLLLFIKNRLAAEELFLLKKSIYHKYTQYDIININAWRMQEEIIQ